MTTTDASPEAAPPESAAFRPNDWLILATLCGATFMTGLDFSIVTVALPEIGRALGFASTGDLQWVATACLLPTAGLMPLFGKAADIIGRRTLFLAGVVLFTGFSLVAGLAATPGVLILSRAGQGVAAAMIAPTAIALITGYFAEGPRRTRALGIDGAVLSMGFVLGTIGGGIVTSGLSWRWTMLIMVVIGAAVLLGALTVLPRGDRRTSDRIDVTGAVTVSIGLFALVHAISTAPETGWGRPLTWGSLLVAAAALAAFLLQERRHPSPLVPLSLLSRPQVAWGGLIGVLTHGACAGTTVLLSIYMQDILGYSPLGTGFGFLAEGAAAILAGVLAPRFITRWGKARVLGAALLVQGIGTASMFALPARDGLTLLLITSAAMGFGHVLAVVCVINIMTSGLREDEQGVAGGLSQLPQFLGAVGIAVLAAVVAVRTEALSPARGEEAATLSGLHLGMVTAGVIACLAAVMAVGLLRRTEAPDRVPAAAEAGAA